MLDDGFLGRFKAFVTAENHRNPQGAFDAALPKAKFRFVPVPHTANTLFLRERSANLALDEATEISDPAKDILNFLRTKLSDDDMRQVEEMLKLEAGVKPDSRKDAEAMISGAEARRAGAEDAKRRQLALDAHATASDARQAEFAARFPGAARIGQV